jgi:hypothetical protein
MIKRLIYLASTLTVVGSIATLVTQATSTGWTNAPDARSVVELLRSSELADLIRARDTVRSERRELISALLAVADREDNEADLSKRWLTPKCFALERLGELRPDDPYTIRAITKHLKYEVRRDIADTLGDMDDPSLKYPAVGALVKIGHPALKFAWYQVEMSTDPLERELCTWIIRQVQGYEVAKYLLEKQAARADFERKPRFEAAQAILEKFGPTTSTPWAP